MESIKDMVQYDEYIEGIINNDGDLNECDKRYIIEDVFYKNYMTKTFVNEIIRVLYKTKRNIEENKKNIILAGRTGDTLKQYINCVTNVNIKASSKDKELNEFLLKWLNE